MRILGAGGGTGDQAVQTVGRAAQNRIDRGCELLRVGQVGAYVALLQVDADGLVAFGLEPQPDCLADAAGGAGYRVCSHELLSLPVRMGQSLAGVGGRPASLNGFSG